MAEDKQGFMDISVPLSNTIVTWPGDPKPDIHYVKTLAEGGSSNVSGISMSSHIGTHVDAPLHFIDGAASIDKVSLDTLVGPARVVDMRNRAVITKSDLESVDLNGVARVLFKTDASDLWDDPAFHEEFPHLDDKAAEYLVAIGVRLIGVDYLSVEQYKGRTRETHKIILGAGVIIIEGLDLRKVDADDYELICLPLKVAGMEAAPARAVLRRIG
jgi:arylformamidase